MLKNYDPRFILETSDYPSFIPIDLPPLMEKLIKDYEKLTKDNSYSAYLEDTNETAREANYINRLKAIYLLMILGDQSMIKELEEFDIFIDEITPDQINRVKSLIELQETNLDIYLIRQKQDDTEDQKEFNFLEVLTRLSNVFQRNIPREISVVEFVVLTRDAKMINKFRKHGRNNKFR